MSELTDVIDCIVTLAAVIHSHLVEHETHANYDTFSPEPSDDVNTIIEQLGRIKGMLQN